MTDEMTRAWSGEMFLMFNIQLRDQFCAHILSVSLSLSLSLRARVCRRVRACIVLSRFEANSSIYHYPSVRLQEQGGSCGMLRRGIAPSRRFFYKSPRSLFVYIVAGVHCRHSSRPCFISQVDGALDRRARPDCQYDSIYLLLSYEIWI